MEKMGVKLDDAFMGPTEMAFTALDRGFRLAAERIEMAKKMASNIPDYDTHRGPIIPPDIAFRGKVVSSKI